MRPRGIILAGLIVEEYLCWRRRREEKKRECVSDLPGYCLKPSVGKKSLETTSIKSSQHLDGGIVVDEMWQNYWRRLVVYHSLYDAKEGGWTPLLRCWQL
jgi:hypothetical protein